MGIDPAIDAVIIGAGINGMAAAARLAAGGWRVALVGGKSESAAAHGSPLLGIVGP